MHLYHVQQFNSRFIIMVQNHNCSCNIMVLEVPNCNWEYTKQACPKWREWHSWVQFKTLIKLSILQNKPIMYLKMINFSSLWQQLQQQAWPSTLAEARSPSWPALMPQPIPSCKKPPQRTSHSSSPQIPISDQEAHGLCDGPGSTFICSAKSTYPVRWGPLFQLGSKPEKKKGETWNASQKKEFREGEGERERHVEEWGWFCRRLWGREGGGVGGHGGAARGCWEWFLRGVSERLSMLSLLPFCAWFLCSVLLGHDAAYARHHFAATHSDYCHCLRLTGSALYTFAASNYF